MSEHHSRSVSRAVSGRGYDVLRFIDEILEILWIEVGVGSTYSKSFFR